MNLYEQNKEKTRVLVAGQTNGIAELMVYILNFNNKNIDYILKDGKTQLNDEDFVLLETDNPDLAKEFHPNIVLITQNENTEIYSDLLGNIVGGGIFIYPESYTDLQQKIEDAETFFRKIPYPLQQVNIQNGQAFVSTEFGELPVNITSEDILKCIEGAKTLSQHLGIMEEEFYEALGNFS